MKISGVISLLIIFLNLSACSKGGGIDIVYLKGDVKVDGNPAVTGVIDKKDLSITTGKSSSAILLLDGDFIIALSEESSLQILDGSVNLITGRIFASTSGEVFIKSREISAESENSLFELVSKSGVSVLNNYSGSVFVKGLSPGSAARGLTLNENFSLDYADGAFSPIQSLGTDFLKKTAAIKNLSDVKNRKNSDILNYISKECLDLINGSYGRDIEERHRYKALTSLRGALSEVVTGSGKRIIGAVEVTGSKVKIYTADGEKFLPLSEVRSMKRFNRE